MVIVSATTSLSPDSIVSPLDAALARRLSQPLLLNRIERRLLAQYDLTKAPTATISTSTKKTKKPKVVGAVIDAISTDSISGNVLTTSSVLEADTHNLKKRKAGVKPELLLSALDHVPSPIVVSKKHKLVNAKLIITAADNMIPSAVKNIKTEKSCSSFSTHAPSTMAEVVPKKKSKSYVKQP